MPLLMPSDIVNDVRDVLLQAHEGKGSQRWYLTAYQILNKLPRAIRQRLINERGRPGAGAGKHYSAASLVSTAAKAVPGVEVAYIDPRGMTFEVDQQSVSAGYEVCGIYRLP